MPQPLEPCKICRGQLKKCFICGFKGKRSARAEPKEYTPQQRREDFLGSLYNSMRACGIRSLGTLGTYCGEEVSVEGREGDMLRIVILSNCLEVHAEELEMERPGPLGKYRGRNAVVRERLPDGRLRIALFKEHLLVPSAEVSDVRPCGVDAEVIRVIGDPCAPGAKLYTPHRKPRKNEV